MSETATREQVPAIEGWFTTGEHPALIGNRCTTCGTVFYPKASNYCRNPDCDSDSFEDAELSRFGTVWSYTDAQYQPPPPYVPRGEEHVPFALAAVELAAEQIVILGQVADGFGVGDLSVGAPVELVVEPLYEVDGVPHLIYRWKPVAAAAAGGEA